MTATEEFDAFFVGDGSAALLTGEPNYRKQVEQLFVVKPTDRPEYELENDLKRFGKGRAKYKYDADGEFLEAKEGAYKVFNFLETKSKFVGNVPIKEEDLIITEDDRYVLEYLKAHRIDFNLFWAVAKLLAFQEMGIHDAKFGTKCKCPICGVFTGQIFPVSYLLKLFSRGEFLTHLGSFWLFPVIYRERYEGPIERLNKGETDSGGFVIKNAPVELTEPIRIDYFLEVEPVIKCIDFVNMAEFLKDISDSEGVVVYYKDGVLYVHNSYVGFLGPIDFLNAWCVDRKEEKVDLKKLKDCETYFLQGKRVAKLDGYYWDIETGEKVK